MRTDEVFIMNKGISTTRHPSLTPQLAQLREVPCPQLPLDDASDDVATVGSLAHYRSSHGDGGQESAHS